MVKSEEFVKHFELQKGCKVNIEVVDMEGNPIKNVSFYAAYVSDDMGRGPKDQIRSDGKGCTVIGGLKPAAYMISASHRDYALAGQRIAFDNDYEIKAVSFKMIEGSSLEGSAFCSDGQPASGWEIRAQPVWWRSIFLAQSYPINEDGHLTLNHILPGDYLVSVSMPTGRGSLGLWSTRMTLPPDSGFLELNIPKASPHSRGSISGSIEFIGDEPSRGFWVDARDDSGNFGSTYIDKGQSNFTIDNLVPGLYKINFNVGGIKKTFRNIKAPSEALVFEISVDSNNILKGKVLDKYTGKPVPTFEVRLDNQWIQFEHPEGEFEIASKGDECKRVNVRANGYAMKLSEDICPDAEELTIIKLGIGGAIDGIVHDENGDPVQGAKISYRYKRSRDEDPEGKYITTTDIDGLFFIEDIPKETTWQWFVISHPDYAPELKQIEVEGDYVSDVEIVLKKGGAVEGYVYDTQGNPVSNITLNFLDEGVYDYWNQNRARLGSVTTDTDGFYRITGLPEKLCYGFRNRPYDQLGVVRTAILPRNSETTHLDFGGKWYARGRVLHESQPLGHIKVMLSGNKVGRETAFTAYAQTDSEGRFTFWGIPAGRRYMYWSMPGINGWEQWVEMGWFEFESENDWDMGDFNFDLVEVSIHIDGEHLDESFSQMEVYLQRYDEKRFWGNKVGQLLPRVDPNDPYVFSHLTPGMYEAIVQRSDYPTIRRLVEIEPGQTNHKVDVWIPNGFASLSGKILVNDREKIQRAFRLRSIDQEVTLAFRPDNDGSYRIDYLPAGDYIIGKASVALSRYSNLKEFSLTEGENKILDVEIDANNNGREGYLVVMVVTEDGLPLAGTEVWLERYGEMVYPHFDSDKSKSFAGDAGNYTLYAQYPGYKMIQQTVQVKSKEGLSTQEILKPLVIRMSQ